MLFKVISTSYNLTSYFKNELCKQTTVSIPITDSKEGEMCPSHLCDRDLDIHHFKMSSWGQAPRAWKHEGYGYKG